jgi:DNA-directed RNA polymerase subunit beta
MYFFLKYPLINYSTNCTMIHPHTLDSNIQPTDQTSNLRMSSFFYKKPLIPTPPIPDLVALQYGSFQQFLTTGFIKAFEQNNPLICSYGQHLLNIRFFPEWVQFRKPENTAKQALYLGKTYGCSVYIPILITSTQWKQPKVEWILLGFLPLMTKAGHFVINGIPRVVLYQMVRNPGVYTLLKDSRTRVPTIRIVPEQGSWINITIDKKNRLWITTRLLRRKVSLLIFLQALGVSLLELSDRLEYSQFLQLSIVKPLKSNEKTRHGRILIRAGLDNHPKTQYNACRYLYGHVQEYTAVSRDQEITDETGVTFFREIIWNEKNRQLGPLGREQFQQKVGSITSNNNTLLNTDDMVRATQALLSLVSGERQGDDIDSLNNKRVRGCGDFLTEHLIKGLKEFELVLLRKLTLASQNDSETLWKLQKSSLSKVVSKQWKSFFTSGTLSQFLDETNPLAETTHKRRLTVLGPGGVSSKQTTIQIRGIHPTYYGRLCPIETPEGQNAGLVNSLTVFARPTIDGHLETPFYTVYKGQVQKTTNPRYTIPNQESDLLLAPADIVVSETFTLPKTRLPLRKNWKFDYGMWNQITTQSVGILQMISVATSLIPFLEHDDANRALMGSNMQRQAVPLIQPESAYVQTGLESRVISDVQHSIHANLTGYVTNVSARGIRLYTPPKQRIDYSEITSQFTISSLSTGFFASTLSQVQLGSSSSIEKPKLSYSRRIQKFSKKVQLSLRNVTPLEEVSQPGFAQIKYPNLQLITKTKQEKEITSSLSSFDLYQRTNQSTCKTHRPVVQEGEWIQKSDILADGAASVGGKIALGKNILVAYLPWEGYNFEDAILISDRLVKDDIFTSLHIDYYKIEVKNTQYGLEIISAQVPIEVTDSDRDLLRIQKLQSNGLISVGTWVEEGDYLVGKVTPLNPKGPSIQQQYEKLYNVIMQREHTNVRNTSLRVPKGVQGFVFAVHILPPKEADVSALAPKNAILRVRVALLQRRKIQVGDKMAGRHGNKGIISKILPEYDMPYLPDGSAIDIVLNPLGVPSRMNVGQILECLLGLAGRYLKESYTIDLFDERSGSEASRTLVYSKLLEASIKTKNFWLFEPHHPGKIKLFDGRTGESFDQAITVGCAYMLKLVHLVDDKLHARATGPYSAITQQPVRGRSRNGGQRVGEMEVWALQAYGAAYILQELLTIKSDDVQGRKEAVFQIYTNQPLTFGPPESFRVLIRELQALCFDFKLFGIHSQTGILKSLNLRFLEDLGTREI